MKQKDNSLSYISENNNTIKFKLEKIYAMRLQFSSRCS